MLTVYGLHANINARTEQFRGSLPTENAKQGCFSEECFHVMQVARDKALLGLETCSRSSILWLWRIEYHTNAITLEAIFNFWIQIRFGEQTRMFGHTKKEKNNFFKLVTLLYFLLIACTICISIFHVTI